MTQIPADIVDVFISYKSERRAAARHLARILACYGYSVWFDHALVAGENYEAQIEREIVAAKAVVVLWCAFSVASEAVRSEASWAKSKGKLIPVLIEPCELPLFSTLTQNISVVGAECSPRDHAFDRLLDEIERLVGRPPHPDFKALQSYDADWRSAGAMTLARFPLAKVAASDAVLKVRATEEVAGSGDIPPFLKNAAPDPAAKPRPATMSATAAGLIDDRTVEHTFWQSVKEAVDPAEYIAFLEKFPDGTFAALAFERGKSAIDATKSATVLRRLLGRYPASKLASRVKKRLAEREWEPLRKNKDAAALAKFAAEFDGSPEAVQAQRLLQGLPKRMVAARKWGSMGALAPGITLAVALVYPLLFQSAFQQRLGALVLLYAIAASAWNIVGGYAGQVSVGHVVFFGCGAYAALASYALLGWPPIAGVPFGILASVGIAAIIGVPTLRLSGHYFSMATIAVAELIRLIVTNSGWLGAAVGLSGPVVPRTVFDLSFRSALPYYYLFLAVLVLVLAITWRMETSRMGFYLRAIKNSERAARSLGVAAGRYKLIAYMLSAGLTSLAGALYATMIGFVDPESGLGILTSVKMLIMAALGGAGLLFGPLLGAAILVPLEEISNNLLGGKGAGVTFMVYGAIIMTIARFYPSGLLGLFTAKPKAPAATAATGVPDAAPEAPPVAAGVVDAA